MKGKIIDPVPKYGGKRVKGPVLILLIIFILAAGSFSWIYSTGEGGFNEVRQLARIKCLGCLGLDPVVPGFSEFWIEYPDGHQREGEEVDHPDLVRNTLSKDDVDIMMLFFWTQGCEPCKAQWDEMVRKDIASGKEDGGVEGSRYPELVLRSKDAAVDTDLYKTYTPGESNEVPMTVFLFRNTEGTILWWSQIGEMDVNDVEDLIENIIDFIQADRLKDDYGDITTSDHDH